MYRLTLGVLRKGYDPTMNEHSASGSTVFVVDDDASVCAALKEIFQSADERLSRAARVRDVVARVAAGGLNKQIAADLGVSEVTVKVHRAKAMRKLRAKSVAELVRITDRLGVTPSKAD